MIRITLLLPLLASMYTKHKVRTHVTLDQNRNERNREKRTLDPVNLQHKSKEICAPEVEGSTLGLILTVLCQYVLDLGTKSVKL